MPLLLLPLFVLVALGATAPLYPHVLVPTNHSCLVAADCLPSPQSWCDSGHGCLNQRCHRVPNYPCPYFQRCDEEARACVPRACSQHRDCDDRLFCNGVESCVNGSCTSDFAQDCTGGTCSETQRTCSLPQELQRQRRNLTRQIYHHGAKAYSALRQPATATAAVEPGARLGAFATPTEAPTAAPTSASGLSNNAVIAIVCSIVFVALVVFILLIIALVSR